MDDKYVKDLMIPIKEYGVVSQDATLHDGILALDEAQKKLPPGRQPHRAVLVVDENEKVIGKIGQLTFLKALEPKYNVLGDLGTLSKAGLSSQFISSMVEHFQFFQDNLSDLCLRARNIKVKDVMHPVEEGIDEDASLAEVIHKMVMLQRLSILVTRGGDVVGLLRLSDLFEEISRLMKELTT